MQRVEELVVDPAVHDVHGLVTRRRAHEDAVVAAHEVATFDQLDAHLAGEERVLEVRRVVHAGREHDDVRFAETPVGAAAHSVSSSWDG